MAVRRINTTVYFVKDWDRAITFYRDTLGLKPLVPVPHVWAQFEAPGGGRIALQRERYQDLSWTNFKPKVSEF